MPVLIPSSHWNISMGGDSISGEARDTKKLSTAKQVEVISFSTLTNISSVGPVIV